jgi:hypothetical protein
MVHRRQRKRISGSRRGVNKEETQPLLEQAAGLSKYAQEDEGETEMIWNGSQFAEQGGEGQDEGTQECIADETESGNGSQFAEQDEDEDTQECIATIGITEPTRQQLEELAGNAWWWSIHQRYASLPTNGKLCWDRPAAL